MEHRIVLLSHDGRRVRTIEDEVPRLASSWMPSPAVMRGIVEAPGAHAIRAPRRTRDEVTHLLWDAADEASGPWLAVDDLAGPSGLSGLAGAVEAHLAGEDFGEAPWYAHGWREDVDAWVAARLAETGRRLTGAGWIAKLWGLSAVIRFAAEDAAGAPSTVWFKAASEGFRAEPSLTAAVAAISAELVPAVVAIDRERAWMLLEEFDADDEGAPFDVTLAAAGALAYLQVRSIAHTADLVAAGAPVRSAEETVRQLAALIADSVEADLITPELLARARAAEPWIAERLRELDALGLGQTLVHGDLHTANIGGTPEAPILFDWTDAALGHPFVDGIHLFRSVRAASPLASADPRAGESEAGAQAQAVRAAYLAPWRIAAPDVDIDRAWELAAIAERAFTAVSYEQIARAQPPVSRWELVGLVGRSLRELVDLVPVDPATAPRA